MAAIEHKLYSAEYVVGFLGCCARKENGIARHSEVHAACVESILGSAPSIVVLGDVVFELSAWSDNHSEAIVDVRPTPEITEYTPGEGLNAFSATGEDYSPASSGQRVVLNTDRKTGTMILTLDKRCWNFEYGDDISAAFYDCMGPLCTIPRNLENGGKSPIGGFVPTQAGIDFPGLLRRSKDAGQPRRHDEWLIFEPTRGWDDLGHRSRSITDRGKSV
jgi:hypothetical protein